MIARLVRLLQKAAGMRIVLLALLPACSLYFGPGGESGSGSGSSSPSTTSYQLVVARSMAGEHDVAGVDSDGAGGVWIAYADNYYTPKQLWVTHLDAAGTKLSEWSLDDVVPIRGLAFGGGAVWLNHTTYSGGGSHISKLDATTGATLKQLATSPEIADLSYDRTSDELLLSYHGNQVATLDANTGGELAMTGIPSTGYTTQHGVAVTGSRMWVNESFSNAFFLVDRDGTQIATATAPILGTTDYIPAGLEMGWDGSQLIVVYENQIFWFTLQPA